MSVWLVTLGLALLTSVLWERKLLAFSTWLMLLGVLALVIAVAMIRPAWFRGYYRVSLRVGVALTIRHTPG